MRIRTVKPELFLHHALFKAEREDKLPLRLAYIGLWCAADREGRFKDEPERLKVQILPYDQDVDFSRVLHALTTRGFIVKYAVDGASFYYIPSFKVHQVINNRERPSTIPDPTQCAGTKDVDASRTREPRVTDASPTREQKDQVEGKGREGNMERKGKEEATVAFAPSAQEEKPKAKSFVPPTKAELELYATKLGLPLTEAEEFDDFYASKGWMVGKSKMVSWQRTMCRWYRRWRREQDERKQTKPKAEEGTFWGPAPAIKIL